MRRYVDTYLGEARVAMQQQAQYRLPAFFNLAGFMIEPVVYLVVWRTVAQQSGAIGGYGVKEFTSYYIVWTLVRVMNLALAPGAWDWWIQNGRIANELLHPVGIYHRQLANFAGGKVVWMVMWIPMALFLGVVFRPELAPSILQGVSFFFAIWLGYWIRFNVLWLMGLISFWTTKAQALIEVVIALEVLLSGRLVPMAVMPDWVAAISAWLPFKWTFQFPIEALIGQLSDEEVLVGLGIQLAWGVGTAALIGLLWKSAVKRFTAVGS